jgi:Abnormal spindle-like microcephaly-assoc'd, ASPM-SPD-2-Hydin/HYDIN/CFA65/VesB-like, Ig-like domain
VTSFGLVRPWAPFLFVSVFLVLLPLQAHTQQIVAAPTALGFGNVLLGSSLTQAVSITNTGSASLSVSKVSANGTGYAVSGLTCPFTLSPGQSALLNVTFAPPAVGTDSGSVLVNAYTQTWRRHRRWGYASSTTTSATVALSGSGISAAGQISASPTSLIFGNLLPGTSQTLNETLTNTGTTSVTISQASMSSAMFTASSLSLPSTLGAGQSVTFGVVFTPNVAGSITGKLSILSDASNPQLSIALSGSESAPGQLTLSPANLNFGSVGTGSKVSLSGTLSATGSPVTISAGTSTSGEFMLGGISLPATLAAGQSVPFTVTFSPQTSGSASASLSFVSNATNSPVTESLSGSGVAPTQHSVNLSWGASSSLNVQGYNVYRAAISGGPYAAVVSANSGTTFVDGSVQSGQTYYYVVTAVDTSGTESVYSNQVQAVIPSP